MQAYFIVIAPDNQLYIVSVSVNRHSIKMFPTNPLNTLRICLLCLKAFKIKIKDTKGARISLTYLELWNCPLIYSWDGFKLMRV